MDLFFYILSFCLFTVIQALAINGIHYCFKGESVKNDLTGKIVYSGNVFYSMAPKFFEKNKYKWWAKPLWKCVRCMASVYSIITFWPVIISIFGWHYEELFIWGLDAFVLVTLNWIIYKKL